jgi:hypothetical protein
VGVSLADLTEESRFGNGARKEIIKWFPGARWVKRVDASPETRELYVLDRRRFLWTVGLSLVAPAACGEALTQLLFIAIEMAAKYYLGSSAEGSAIFGTDSPSREAFQLLTKLVEGTPESKGTLQDEGEYNVNVPAKAKDFAYFFSGMLSDQTGDHYVQGLAKGEKQNSNVFQYEEQ